jgi:hypothetical protein
LAETCVDHALGFGMDREVNVVNLEAPAVAGVLPTVSEATWALRRVVVPFWAILAGTFGLLMIWALTAGVKLYRVEHGLCAKCSYDVSECSHFCPRCGKAIPKRTWSGDDRPRRGAAPA